MSGYPLNVEPEPVKRQQRALRRLLRDLVIVGGTAIAATPRKPRKVPQPGHRRVLFRRAHSLNDDDLDRLVTEVGAMQLMSALDRWTQPSLSLEAAE